MTDNTQKPKKHRRTGKHETGPAQRAGAAALVEAEVVSKHSVGKKLRAARTAMNLSLEEVSAAINVRVAQLQAIEEDRIDRLPGMTYAVGFVRSYAAHLKLDSKELIDTFKREHAGEEATKTALKFNDPIVEDKLPSPMMLGIAAVAVVMLFIVWSIFADGDMDVDIAQTIPPAPVVGTASGQPTVSDIAPLSQTSPLVTSAAPDTAITTTTTPVTTHTETAPVTSTPAPGTASFAVPPVTALAPVVTAPPVINVKSGKGRVVIEATQKSWVQVSDGANKVIFKKVMNPGETFFVPDQRGMTMVTSNAGGIDLIVDGQKVQAVGRPGEILRGVALAPDELKKKKIRVRD